MLKRTTEEVAQYFKEHGCELLDEYRGAMTKMKYRCHCGKISAMSWNNFTKGKRCGCDSKFRNRYTLEKVQALFNAAGCELISQEYINGEKALIYKCRCGVIRNRSLHQFLHCGKYCSKCAHAIMGLKHRKPDTQLKAKFRKKCYKALQSTLKTLGKKKVGRTTDVLGYGPAELQEHIIHHSNWERVKDTDWHLDHIFPIEAFVEHEITDLKIINALDNLQPITQHENNSKHAKYNEAEFLEWLNGHVQKMA